MVFHAKAAVFQIYSGDEHEMDDKINRKMGWDTRIIRVNEFILPLKKLERWVGSDNLAFCNDTEPTLFRFFNVRGT